MTSDADKVSENTTEKKKALVLGGGGSRGSYTLGVLQILRKQGFRFDLVTGISIGSIIGAVFASDQDLDEQEMIDAFSEESMRAGLFHFPERAAVLKDRLVSFNEYIELFQKGGPDIDPLKDAYLKLFDFEAFRKSETDFACFSADLTLNRMAVFEKKNMRTKEDAMQAMLASAAFFPGFRYVKIKDHFYADGGYLKYSLGTYALEHGAKKLVIVALSDPDEYFDYRKEQTELLIRPILKPMYFLDFNREIMERQISQGRLEAMKYLDLVPGYLYTFFKEDLPEIDRMNRELECIAEYNRTELKNEILIDTLRDLLGYRPARLDSSYMKKMQPALLFEALGVLFGIDFYRQIHFCDLLARIKDILKSGEIPLHPDRIHDGMKMDQTGDRDLMSLLGNALIFYDGRLPDEFDQIIRRFPTAWQLTLAAYALMKSCEDLSDGI